MTTPIDLHRMGITKTVTLSPAGETNSLFYTAEEVAGILGVSLSTAYREIRRLNEEPSAQGYLIVPGKISKRYFSEKSYL